MGNFEDNASTFGLRHINHESGKIEEFGENASAFGVIGTSNEDQPGKIAQQTKDSIPPVLEKE